VTIYCAPSPSGAADGSDWDNAIGTIAGAIAAATAEEVWVKEGTFVLTGVINAVAGIDMFGSFDSALTGTSGTKGGRDFVTDPTIIDGDDSYQIVELDDSDWSGFHFFDANTAVSAVRGSGVTCDIDDCVFESGTNTSNYGGASMIRDTSTVNFNRCTMIDNMANRGGAIAVRYSSTVTCTDCVIGSSGSGNTATTEAGAIYVSDAAAVVLVDCEIAHNSCANGGAIRVVETGSSATLTRCKMHDNNSSTTDGGALVADVGSLTATSCLFYDNTANDEGGAVKLAGTGVTGLFDNCVFEGNTAADYTIKQTTGTLTMHNCVVWGNTGGAISSTGGSVSVTYSDVEGAYTGTGNINSNPNFVGSGDNPYDIGSTSPCIDAGDGDEAPTLDFLGQARYDDPAVGTTGTGTPAYTDIGAYEYQGAPSPPVDLGVKGVKIMGMTPAERARGGVFNERFESMAKVARNGGVATGTPIVDFGATFNGTTDYLTYTDIEGAFDSAEISFVLEFYPDFAPTEDVTRYPFAAAGDYFVYIGDSVASNSMRIRLGTVTIRDIAVGTYSPYWLVGQKNVLVVSGTSGNTSAWLNGVSIMANDVSAWSPVTVSALQVGTRASFFFDGKITKFQIYHALLTADEAADFYNDETYTYHNEPSLNLPFSMASHDPTNVRALDVSGNGRHAVFGDGSTPTTYPTKLGYRDGYNFDGGDYMLATATGIYNAAGVTIAIEFTPGFEANDGTARAFLDASAGARYTIRKEAANTLRVQLGNTIVQDIPLANYGPYWIFGGRNILIISGVTGDTSAWLNGNIILANDNTAWTAADPAVCSIGGLFIGQINSIRVWRKALTPLQVADLC